MRSATWVLGRSSTASARVLGYAVAFSIWTLGHIGHGFVHSITQFALVRFTLGLGESGGFPASLKAVSEWFPQKERALAVGIFNAGSNVGAIITPLVVPAITAAWGWRRGLHRDARGHRRVADRVACDLSPPRRAPEAFGVGAGVHPFERRPGRGGCTGTGLLDEVATAAGTWAYALGKFLTDPVWWLYCSGYRTSWASATASTCSRSDRRSSAVYLLSDVGSVAGGWGSSRLMKGRRTANAARKITMLICALVVVPIVFAQFVSQLWAAVAISAAAAGSPGVVREPHDSAVDMFPRAAVALSSASAVPRARWVAC